MNLDVIAAAGCTWIAACLFMLNAVSNPKHSRWMTMPSYVRCGLIMTGAIFVWRAVNLFTLPPTLAVPGHMNAEGIILTGAVAYTMTALVVWAGIFKRLPTHGWPRVHYAEQEVKKGLVPVMATPRAVKEAELEKGFVVNGQMLPRRKVASTRA